MATLMILVALGAAVAALIYAGRKRWRAAALACAIFVIALIINAQLHHTVVQQQQARNNNFPLPLNSGAGAAGSIPK